MKGTIVGLKKGDTRSLDYSSSEYACAEKKKKVLIGVPKHLLLSSTSFHHVFQPITKESSTAL